MLHNKKIKETANFEDSEIDEETEKKLDKIAEQRFNQLKNGKR